MPYFGIPIRNGLPLGLGTVASLSSRPPAAVPPVTFAVLPSGGSPTYLVSRVVFTSAGASYTVPGTVLNSSGTSYTPI